MGDKRETKEISHKVGIKLLSDEQLYNTFPGFEDLWRKIEEFKEARIESLGKRRYQDALMYDNVFSILGERGTGKTSVLYTLREKIETLDKGDMVFPIIMPEIIPEECDILDWVLAIISEKLEEILGDQKLDYTQRCYVRDMDELRVKLKKICELSFSVKYNPSAERSFYEVVSNSERQAQNAFVFARKLTEFWTELVGFLSLIKDGGSKDKKTMLYFFFDDVDLAPERVENLFSVITKYLAHPNIIVIITADENQIEEVTEINITNRMKKLPREWQYFLERKSREAPWYSEHEQVDMNYMNYMDCKSAKAYLLKILPTSTRYYLKEFAGISEKQNFIIEGKISLDLAVKNLMMQFYGDKEFSGEHVEEMSFYFHFIGDSSRKMGNAYYIMRQFVKGVLILAEKAGEGSVSGERYKKNLYEAARQFITLILHSNTEKFDCIREGEFVDEFFLRQYNQWDLYVNYRAIRRFYEKNMQDEDEEASGYAEKKKAFLDISISLFALGFFVDRVLQQLNQKVTIKLCSDKQKYYAQNELAGFINEKIFSGREMIQKDMEMSNFLEHYELVLKDLGRLYIFDRNNAENVYDYLHCFSGKPWLEDKNFVKKLFYEERMWFENILSITSMAYENVFVFGKELPEKTDIFGRELDMEFVRMVRQDVREIIEDFLCSWKLNRRGECETYDWDRSARRESLFWIVKERIDIRDDFVLLEDLYEECRENIIECISPGGEWDEEITIEHIKFFCSDPTEEILQNLLANVTDIRELERCLEVMRDKIQYQYKGFEWITILDPDKYFENAGKIGNSQMEAYGLYRGMIEDALEEGKRVAYDNRILNFARNVKKILGRKSKMQRDVVENNSIYAGYVVPYQRLMESVAVCIRAEELDSAIDFCIDVISYLCVIEWYMACKVEWVGEEQIYTSKEISSVPLEDGIPYYVGFYNVCEEIMGDVGEEGVVNAFETIILEARQEYADYILN